LRINSTHYNFDFLTLRSDAHERDLEQGLLDHIQKFLLEPGVGFAFVGRQYHMEISGQDYYLNLLFYQLLPLVYQEVANLAAFKNSVGTCHYFASQFKSAEFFALLGSISRIKG